MLKRLLVVMTAMLTFGLSSIWTDDSIWADDPIKETGSAQKKEQPAEKPLDEQLLDDLDDELFEGELFQGLDGQASTKQGKKNGVLSQTDRKLLDQLGEGEDVGEEDPLTKIAKRMRAVEQRIGSRDTSETTQQIQQKIIADLAVLIELQKKKCAECAKSGTQQTGQAKPAAGKKPGDKPSRDSTNRVGQSDQEKVRADELRDMLKKVWGHLPPRLRQQIQSGSIEEFLPKYEKLIERYYERLAEEPGTGG